MARAHPIPVAITRKVPQKNASPIPDKGPISAAFTSLIASESKSSWVAFASSMAALIPNGNVLM